MLFNRCGKELKQFSTHYPGGEEYYEPGFLGPHNGDPKLGWSFSIRRIFKAKAGRETTVHGAEIIVTPELDVILQERATKGPADNVLYRKMEAMVLDCALRGRD
jgi:hypothetical protein